MTVVPTALPDASASIFRKWHYYRARYGGWHAAWSGLGRYCPRLWRWVGGWVTTPYRRRWLRQTGAKTLNLGSGSNCLPGCLNVDVDPRADACVDLRRRLPFPDQAIDAVFCEEVLEHLDGDAGHRLLRECARILKPGGVLRLSTPDLDYGARRVVETGQGAELRAMFQEHAHRCLYTRRDLAEALAGAGFGAIRRSSYRDPESRLGSLDSHAERFAHGPEISQYVEALTAAAQGAILSTIEP